MTFLRLIIIYLIVILGVVAVFNRAAVMAMVGIGDPVAEQAVEHTPANAEQATQTEPAHASETPATPAATATYAPAAEPSQPQATAAMDTVEQQIETARQAYWAGDMAGAERALQAALDARPDSTDLHGEIGNLYFAQARYAEAAQHYRVAGEGLIKSGRQNQVLPLVATLQAIDPQGAQNLRNLIGTTGQ